MGFNNKRSIKIVNITRVNLYKIHINITMYKQLFLRTNKPEESIFSVLAIVLEVQFVYHLKNSYFSFVHVLHGSLNIF